MKLLKLRKRVSQIFIILAITSAVFVIQAINSMAATDPVRMWNLTNDERVFNRSVAVGESGDAVLGYKLNDIEEKSHTWSVEDGDICRIEDSGTEVKLIGLEEGVTKLTVKIKAKDGKTYSDYVVVSVITRLTRANAKTIKSTMATRSASYDAAHHNERDELPKGTKLTVFGKCGNYYRASVDYEFTDGIDSKNAYMLKSDVDVPANKLTLDTTTIQLDVNKTRKLKANIEPDYATDKTLKWESSNNTVVSVDAKGAVKAISAGTATITVKTSDGGESASCKVTVPPTLVNKITLDNTAIKLEYGEKKTLKSTIEPNYASNKNVTWESSDNKIVSVDKNGSIKALAAGTANITVKSEDGGASASCKVTVPPVLVSKITLDKTSIRLEYSKTKALKSEIEPNYATNKEIDWESSNTKVATVDKSGIIKALAAGTASITVKSEDGGASASCKVTVPPILVNKIILDSTSLQLRVGETKTLQAKIEPTYATNKNISWESSSPKIATVDNNGAITAKRCGKTKIRVKSADGATSAICNVNVFVITPEAAAKSPRIIKPKVTGYSTSLNSVTLKVSNGTYGGSNFYVLMNGKKVSAKTYNLKFQNKKIKSNKFTMRRKADYTIKIDGLKKDKEYHFKVGVPAYMSNEVKVTTGVPTLNVTQKGNNLVLKWNKIKGSKGYYIYRGTSKTKAQKSKNAYKKIKPERTVKFIDKGCESGKTYYYVVRAKKSNKKTQPVKGRIVEKRGDEIADKKPNDSKRTDSKKEDKKKPDQKNANKKTRKKKHVEAKLSDGTVVNVSYNLDRAKKSSLFKNVAINSDAKWNANKYTLPNGSYPPVKYRFTGSVLEIHLYLDFVQYNEVGSVLKCTNDPKEKIGNRLCTDLFIEGLKKGYDGIKVTSGGGNFGKKGFTFETKLIVHRARKERLDSAQRFIQIRIGGLAPKTINEDGTASYVDFDGDQWFHASMYTTPEDSILLPYVHMPTNAQLKQNKEIYINQRASAIGYRGCAAHETGHILGLKDAYKKIYNGEIVDRCAENTETCNYIEEKYWNIMKNGGWTDLEKQKMRPNDFEMMLYAYSLSENGTPQFASQFYKSFYDGEERTISTQIRNKTDELVED